jgi:hypothetical protein
MAADGLGQARPGAGPKVATNEEVWERGSASQGTLAMLASGKRQCKIPIGVDGL